MRVSRFICTHHYQNENVFFEEKVAYFDLPIVLLHCGKYEKITWNRF